MKTQLNRVDTQCREYKAVLKAYGIEKRKLRKQTNALLKKARKLKNEDLQIIATLKGIELPDDSDDCQEDDANENDDDEKDSEDASTVSLSWGSQQQTTWEPGLFKIFYAGGKPFCEVSVCCVLS